MRFNRDMERNMEEKIGKMVLTDREENMIAAFGGTTWEIGNELGRCNMSMEELSEECINVGIMWKLANYPYEEMNECEFGDFVCIYNIVKWNDVKSEEDLNYHRTTVMIELLDLDDFPKIKNMKLEKVAKLYCSESFDYINQLEGLAILKRIVKASDKEFAQIEGILKEYKGV